MKPKIGDWVKSILKPFVKGTRFENCSKCEERRQKLNAISTGFASWLSKWIAKISCPCWYRSWFN